MSSQAPKLPTGGNKRRMPEAPTPEMLKRMRAEAEAAESSSKVTVAQPTTNGTSGKGKARAYVRDEEEEEAEAAMDEDGDFAPGNDADYFVEEDDEGRFFGGGLTEEQKTILNIFEKSGGEGTLDDDVSGFSYRLASLTALRSDVDSTKA